MSRLVVVSNRVADLRRPAAGGLAVALGETLNRTGGLWFGWSGRVDAAVQAAGETGAAHLQRAGPATLATVDLTPAEHDSYYLGYSNRVLWPVFHTRLDLADFEAGHFEGYLAVNQRFARELMPLLRPDDVIWVHDYHLIPLGHELRRLGCAQRIGFFLHIPLPPPLLLAAIPQHAQLVRALFAYDLVGLQSRTDVQHFARYVRNEAGASEADGAFHAFGRSTRAGAFPIGIDVAEFRRLAAGRDAQDAYQTLREQYARRRLLIGVDRLDYSKGIPHRIRAFRELLRRCPEHRASATLIQIASPTRENVDAYADIRTELERLTGAINGEFGELDWMPVRYMHRTVARRRIPGLCRAACVGLITPLRDGMNLVAKEYVAAQDPEDPGVLVLSRFAGAAEQMPDALLVNPYDVHGTAQAIEQALTMPLAERRYRHRRLLEVVERYDVHWWRQSFLTALAGTHAQQAEAA